MRSRQQRPRAHGIPGDRDGFLLRVLNDPRSRAHSRAVRIAPNGGSSPLSLSSAARTVARVSSSGALGSVSACETHTTSVVIDDLEKRIEKAKTAAELAQIRKEILKKKGIAVPEVQVRPPTVAATRAGGAVGPPP